MRGPGVEGGSNPCKSRTTGGSDCGLRAWEGVKKAPQTWGGEGRGISCCGSCKCKRRRASRAAPTSIQRSATACPIPAAWTVRGLGGCPNLRSARNGHCGAPPSPVACPLPRLPQTGLPSKGSDLKGSPRRGWLGGWRRLPKAAGGYCRLQIPSKLALAARGTVAGHRLGTLGGASDASLASDRAMAAKQPTCNHACPRASVHIQKYCTHRKAWNRPESR